MTGTLTEPVVERFRMAVQALLQREPQADAPLALAVSGGADSMAMLTLAHAAYGGGEPGRIIAATVDHGLRPESAAEAAMVAGHCARLGMPHATLVLTGLNPGSAVQARAREGRYSALTQWAVAAGAAGLATAHQADDQAETMLMRAARGVGLTGMRAIPARRLLDDILLIRPLLGWTRAELRALVTSGGIPFADDPGNVDPAYERVRTRAMLADHPWLRPEMLARTGQRLAEADEALDVVRDRLWQERSQCDAAAGTVRIDVSDVPLELRRRLLRQALAEVRRLTGIDSPPFSPDADVQPLLSALESGRSATQAGVMASVKGRLWHFRPAPPRRSA